ncbi:MAG: GPW/gp25 family protein [Bacteroidota bacterium]
MDNYQSFLGRGWAFPPAFDKKRKGAEMLENEADIQSSLEVLLSTRLGERVMLPEYGCALDRLLFEPLTTSLSTFINDLIETAILYHEPRIDVEGIDLSESQELEGLLLIKVDFLVRATNTRYNIVYPFYKNEGNNS